MNKSWPIFRTLNTLGILLGTALALLLGWRSALSPLVIIGLTFVSVMSILSPAMVVKVITGEEYLPNNYHTQMLVLGSSAVLLGLLRLPVLPYLDLVALGLGLSIVFGRIGCLKAGCCHGRPARRGVRYGSVHVAEGFPACLAGVRLLPVQAFESLWALGIVIVGTALVLSGQPPGTALAWHIVAYGVGRFLLEFLRGDADRPYWRGFSEAQWTALITTSAVAVAGWGGILPFQVWQIGSAIGLAAVIIAVAMWRRWEPDHLSQLLHPRHIQQVAEALDKLADLSKAQWTLEGELPAGSQLHLVPMASTALGLELSAGYVEREGRRTYHYTLSNRSRRLTYQAAGALGELIIRLRHPTSSREIIVGRQAGIFHVLIRPAV
jgi:prolipoprotein diacylglyceryltransferase